MTLDLTATPHRVLSARYGFWKRTAARLCFKELPLIDEHTKAWRTIEFSGELRRLDMKLTLYGDTQYEEYREIFLSLQGFSTFFLYSGQISIRCGGDNSRAKVVVTIFGTNLMAKVKKLHRADVTLKDEEAEKKVLAYAVSSFGGYPQDIRHGSDAIALF